MTKINKVGVLITSNCDFSHGKFPRASATSLLYNNDTEFV